MIAWETHDSQTCQATLADRWCQLLVLDPHATVIVDGDLLAVGHGLDKEGEALLRRTINLPKRSALLKDFVIAQEESTVILADLAGLRGPTLEAWRGATSNFEAYVTLAEDGRSLTVSDHFRNALARVPADRRMLDSDAVADHLLFATVPGNHSYVTAIRRLGHGECLRWENGHCEWQLFDFLVSQPHPPSLDDIDDCLSRAFRSRSLVGGCVNQLSGGVDSSLLQTYLPPGASTVSGAIDSPEFEREQSYAKQASKLLATNHEFFKTCEREYQSTLVDAIRSCGLPVHMPQTVVYQATLGHPGKLFVNGQFADALFGLRASIPYAIAFGQRHWLCLAEMLRLDRMLPESKATGLRRRNERVVQIAMPISHWQGLGARFALYTNIPVAEQILGQATIKRRIEARAEYVERRFRSEERDLHPLYAHLEFGHVLDFYCDESVSQWRQIAHARGKGLFAPFVFGSVVRAALAVERGERYLANGRIKYLLKDLLKRRVPAFDVDAQKAGGDLPFSRYLKSGPLRDTFDQYLMPDLVEPRVSAVTREAADWLTWNLLTFAIWRDELFANTTLGILPGTHILAPSYRYNS